jgi:hypothetical protein
MTFKPVFSEIAAASREKRTFSASMDSNPWAKSTCTRSSEADGEPPRTSCALRFGRERSWATLPLLVSSRPPAAAISAARTPPGAEPKARSKDGKMATCTA